MAKTVRYIGFVVVDLFLIISAYLLIVWIKPGEDKYYLSLYLNSSLIFLGLWVFQSYFLGKYKILGSKKSQKLFSRIVISNLIILASISMLMYLLRAEHYSRTIVFGTVGIASLLELFTGNMYRLIKKAKQDEFLSDSEYKIIKQVREEDLVDEFQEEEKQETYLSSIDDEIRKLITYQKGEAVFLFIANYLREVLNFQTYVVSTTTRFNIVALPREKYFNIINLQRINDIRRINKFFEAVNGKLKKGGRFICCVETKDLRKKRIFKKFFPPFNWVYYFFDFIIKRVFPKFWLTKKLYFYLTRGQNRVISRAEALGRLYSCGFEVEEEAFVDKLLFIVARKIQNPAFDYSASYGPFIQLHRVGKGGEIINVYKLRTMHPYAEYLQEYVYQKHKLQEGGKFRNDFRINSLGRFMRKFWIDELPMILNVLKGDMKIVGVRPISKQYFDLYTKELQEKRIKYKPGLFPPFYADMPENLNEIIHSELRYLNAYEKHPLRTDLKYFFKIVYAILVKKKRSS